ncbi:MAG: extracellular solute-binding protein [Treponema sp.]|jgi:ABC-type glycerol-3-phosphate transport system substrate-binding protein|nr:extracellular solute-binding protein [Treponema sp.]
MLKKTMFFALIVLLLAVSSHVWAAGKADLKNMDITIGNWYENYNTEKPTPNMSNTNVARDTFAWRTKLQKDNNFKMREEMIAGWGGMRGEAMTSIMSGSPSAQVFVLEPGWALQLMGQDLIYPITDNKLIDFRNPQPIDKNRLPVPWNTATLDAFTFNGKGYAISVGVNVNNAQVIFFNKRLFREAGLSADLPYDLQKNGRWTWDEFLKVCKQLTRDINNDGIVDTYALPRDLSTDMLDAFVSSNGAQYIARERSGRFVNAAGRPEFLEALQYTIRLQTEGVLKPKPEDANWDWYKAEFADGKVAMRVDESYVWGELQNMKDDWGVVLPPKGPRSSDYRVFTRENVMVIPATYTPEMVEKILYAMQLWFTPVSNDAENWKASYANTFRDNRAVNETLAMIRETRRHLLKNFNMIGLGNKRGEGFAWEMWYFDGEPAQLVESVRPAWQVVIDDANEVFK